MQFRVTYNVRTRVPDSYWSINKVAESALRLMIINVTHLTILAPKLCLLMGVGSGGLGSYAYFIYKDRYNTGIENRGRYFL